ncbi:MAG: hypothetical protein IJJ45_05930 [Clostridia bacterium]|nr:hypothetical protein [Clostridia bacterium]
MIPFGNEAVTLVRRIEAAINGRTQVTYQTETLTGCSWQRTNSLVREGEALRQVEGIVCRVPAGQTKPVTGDLMILGAAAVTVTGWADYQGLIEAYRGTDKV